MRARPSWARSVPHPEFLRLRHQLIEHGVPELVRRARLGRMIAVHHLNRQAGSVVSGADLPDEGASELDVSLVRK